jgi:hypothetical protein
MPPTLATCEGLDFRVTDAVTFQLSMLVRGQWGCQQRPGLYSQFWSLASSALASTLSPGGGAAAYSAAAANAASQGPYLPGQLPGDLPGWNDLQHGLPSSSHAATANVSSAGGNESTALGLGGGGASRASLSLDDLLEALVRVSELVRSAQRQHRASQGASGSSSSSSSQQPVHHSSSASEYLPHAASSMSVPSSGSWGVEGDGSGGGRGAGEAAAAAAAALGAPLTAPLTRQQPWPLLGTFWRACLCWPWCTQRRQLGLWPPPPQWLQPWQPTTQAAHLPFLHRLFAYFTSYSSVDHGNPSTCTAAPPGWKVGKQQQRSSSTCAVLHATAAAAPCPTAAGSALPQQALRTHTRFPGAHFGTGLSMGSAAPAAAGQHAPVGGGACAPEPGGPAAAGEGL